MEFLTNEFFLIALTFVVFALATLLRKRFDVSLLNPILITVIILVLFLKVTGIGYNTYQEGGRYIDFWLKPAVVALGLPLYKQLATIKKQVIPLLISELAGCIIGIVSVVLLAELFGATKEVALSLAAKSVTTPIAIEVTKTIGGIDALAAAVVVCTGIFGAMAGFALLKIVRVKSPMAQGLALGTAAHAVGTSAALERGGRYGAFSSLGLTLNGLFTAILAPYILSWIGYI